MDRIRVHKASMQTKYGEDIFRLYDDPECPKYKSQKSATVALMEIASFVPSDSNDSEYHGTFEDVGAYFEYLGFTDIVIPETIVQRIANRGNAVSSDGMFTVIWESDQGKSWERLDAKGADELVDNLGAYGVSELVIYPANAHSIDVNTLESIASGNPVI